MTGALRKSDDEVLRLCLERALSETRGSAVTVTDLERGQFAYETSFAIDELKVRLGDGERLRLLVKDVGDAGLSAVAEAAKPSDLLEPAREIAVYRDLLAPAALSAPRFHGATIDVAQRRWWLFLEHVEGEVLTDVGEAPVWEEAAAWAASLGAAVEAQAASLDRLLVHRDAAWHAHWLDAALAALGETDRGDGAAQLLLERLRPGRARLLERLDALPRIFVHGELYASNVVVERSGDRPVRIAPVDWELAGSGPYALDLAALVSGWGEEERLSMCRSFHESLAAVAGGFVPTFDELLEAVALCRLALALQWIGWAPGWQAPAAHRHDWVAEATGLLEEVGQ
jgi:hypothetical protein